MTPGPGRSWTARSQVAEFGQRFMRRGGSRGLLMLGEEPGAGVAHEQRTVTETYRGVRLKYFATWDYGRKNAVASILAMPARNTAIGIWLFIAW